MTNSPRLVVLDSSQLGQWFADRTSDNRHARGQADTFEKQLSDNDYVPLLCWHHLEELLQHENTLTAKRRIRALHSLPRVAWLAGSAEGHLGNIVDILAAEAAIAFYRQTIPPSQIGPLAKPVLINVSTPRHFLGDHALKWLKFQPLLKDRQARARELVAIKRSKFADLSATKVVDLMRGTIANGEERDRNFADLQIKLAADVAERGDRRIPDAHVVAGDFMRQVAQMADATPSSAAQLVLGLMFSRGITAADITEDVTVSELNDLATFRSQLKVASEKLDIPWRELNAKVAMTRVPSTIISQALERYGPELSEYKGSELNDEYLLRLGVYADRTYVDKRTLEALRRARPKVPVLNDLLPDVRRAAHYRDIRFDPEPKAR